MITIDIGNTNVVCGIFFKKKLKKILRFATKDVNIIHKMEKFNFNEISNLDYNICTISSVSKIPERKIIRFFRSIGFTIYNINLKNISKDIKFNYISNQLGADRIANSFAAINKYGFNTIVIDFGTATTFDLMIDGNYVGGIITPGINVSHDALIKRASKLKKISIVKIKKIIANNTRGSMQSGFYWGYVCLINGLIQKIMLENKIKPTIILTGGLADTFKSEIKYKTYLDPHLTLEGLYLIGQKKYA